MMHNYKHSVMLNRPLEGDERFKYSVDLAVGRNIHMTEHLFKSVELKQRCAERSDEMQTTTYYEMKGSGGWLF